jgi:hypothetical protein
MMIFAFLMYWSEIEINNDISYMYKLCFKMKKKKKVRLEKIRYYGQWIFLSVCGEVLNLWKAFDFRRKATPSRYSLILIKKNSYIHLHKVFSNLKKVRAALTQVWHSIRIICTKHTICYYMGILLIIVEQTRIHRYYNIISKEKATKRERRDRWQIHLHRLRSMSSDLRIEPGSIKIWI